MIYLIDTQIFLWLVSDEDKIPTKTKEKVLNLENEIVISIASFWEIFIKVKTGKLDFDATQEEVEIILKTFSIRLLSIELRHTFLIKSLPYFHKDPFDRIIVAQSIAEGIDVISSDAIFDEYFKAESTKRIF